MANPLAVLFVKGYSLQCTLILKNYSSVFSQKLRLLELICSDAAFISILPYFMTLIEKAPESW